MAWFLCKFSAYQKLEPAGCIGDFGNFLNGFAKSPRLLRWSRILNEYNLSWKIVKYYILHQVCMLKTAPHSTLSPQTWCIKKYKRLVCTHPDLLARLCKVNLSKAKNSTRFVFQEFVFHWIWLSTRCKICFTLKSLSLTLKVTWITWITLKVNYPQSHMNVPLS